MKKLSKKLFLMVVLELFISSCQEYFTKEGYICDYESWISKLKQDYKLYREADWNQAEVNFKKFSETNYNRFKDNLTPNERQKIDMLTGQYYAIKAKYKVNRIKNEINSVIDKGKGMLKELQKE